MYVWKQQPASSLLTTRGGFPRKLPDSSLCVGNLNIYFFYFRSGVEFGARMITIDGKQIKLQIWDTVRFKIKSLFTSFEWTSCKLTKKINFERGWSRCYERKTFFCGSFFVWNVWFRCAVSGFNLGFWSKATSNPLIQRPNKTRVGMGYIFHKLFLLLFGK